MSYPIEAPGFSEGFATFTRMAHEYIENLHDPHARRFGLRYLVYLQGKARRLTQSEPGTEPGLCGPDRSLIRIYLRKLYKEHCKKRRRKAA